MRRRDVLSVFALSAAAAQTSPPERKGRLKQCVTNYVFDSQMNFEDRCRVAANLGCKGYDMVRPADWPTLKKYSLVCSLYPPGPGGTIYNALSNRDNHSRLEPLMHAAIDESAANGVKSIITYSGARNGLNDRQGMDNCMTFLGRVKAHAEDKGVTICIEYLNSKVNHPDYMFDHYAWGVELCRRVDSPSCKILWDIYHAQIMDGDIVRNIRDNFWAIGHIHTAGVPGRHEMDDKQELNYRFIAQAIADLGYTGYVAHEYYPTPGRDPIASLKQTIDIFTV